MALGTSRSSATGVVAPLCLSTLTFALLQSSVAPALPAMRHALGTSTTGITWVLTALLLSTAVAIPVMGRIGDLHGRRRVLLVCLTAMAIGSVVSAVATDPGSMIVGRVIQGLGGGAFPLAYGIFRDNLPTERVAGAMNLISASFGLGAGSGIVLADIILNSLDYHWIFWIPGIASCAAVLGVFFAVPDSRERALGEVSWSATLLMSIGLTSVLVAFSQTSVWGWGSAEPVAVAGVGVLFIVAWFSLGRRSGKRLVDARVIAVRGNWIVNMLAVALGAAVFIAAALIPRIAQYPTGTGVGDQAIGAVLLLVPLLAMMLLILTAAGRVESARGSRATTAIGIAAAGVAIALFLALQDHVWTVALASALLGVGAGFALTTTMNGGVHNVPADQTEVARGVNTVAQSVGLAFGGQLGATLLAGSALAGTPDITGSNGTLLVAIAALVIMLAATATLSLPRSAAERA